MSLAQAAPPPTSEAGNKTSRSDAEVAKDDINRLKDEVLNKKTQMLLFRQLLKTEAVESSFPRVMVNHVNEMGNRYKIYSMNYYMDKERIFSFFADENAGRQIFGKDTNVFKGPVAPGQHELLVEIVYQGNDTGIFDYISDYKVPVQAKQNFKVDKGQNIEIKVVAYEKGWALTEFKDSPDISIKLSNGNLSGPKSAKDIK